MSLAPQNASAAAGTTVAFVVSVRQPRLSYKNIALDVWTRTGSRRLILYHTNDSYSGAFPFYADRSVLGLDESQDPRGERLIAAVGSNDVVLAPFGAIDLLGEQARRELIVEATFTSPKDDKKELVLYRRRPSP